MNKLTKLGARRLRKLAKILDTADALHKKRGEPRYNQQIYQYDCGTPACAWGHYVLSDAKIVKRLGMRDSVYAGFHTEQEFGIHVSEADELFGLAGCGHAETAKQAAAYIRSFVKRKGIV